MQIQLTTDPAQFAAQSGAFLAREPISANVIAVVLERTLAGSLSGTSEDLWITITEGAEVVGVAMANSPYNVFVSRQPEAAATSMARSLASRTQSLPGVTGHVDAALAFADEWKRITGQTSVVQIAHQVYRLTELHGPNGISGVARPADSSDTELVATWLDDFHDEALPHDPRVDSVALATERIAGREVWLWQHEGRPVAMTACSPPAAGVARVGPVYTPPGDRRHGYAAGSTAAAVQAALDGGAEHVMLYADQANPTSNALYRRLGFITDHESIDFGFRDP